MRFAYTKKRKKKLGKCSQTVGAGEGEGDGVGGSRHEKLFDFFCFWIFQYLFEANKSYNIMKTPTRFRAIKILLKSPRKIGNVAYWAKTDQFSNLYIYSTLWAINKYYIICYIVHEYYVWPVVCLGLKHFASCSLHISILAGNPVSRARPEIQLENISHSQLGENGIVACCYYFY